MKRLVKLYKAHKDPVWLHSCKCNAVLENPATPPLDLALPPAQFLANYARTTCYPNFKRLVLTQEGFSENFADERRALLDVRDTQNRAMED
jgi:hypothetical protein